ncbi:hypothetical protein [Gracilimonas mengyeensis]|uniref:Uncharacterized protein n=1 Tax=Gracilimonas mengyeensis TaxID=1302730 RepID=A0A521ET52_9BACT|nr:hypothetical protein [Gracilimonas mengyeensis]SMO87072.1 hypothetical protein SAMN06265219_113126 [Gracilimonas mengyeensis]
MSDSIYIDPSFETFLNRVFGNDRYHGFSGNRDKTRWKNTLSKLFDSFEKHIKANIQDDPEQVENIKKELELIKLALRSKQSINDINVNSIRALFEICFQLLGDKIDHTDRKVLNHPSHYKLNKKRTLVYHSDNLQKFWKVHERAGTSKFLDAGVPGKTKLEDFFFDELNGKSDEFILWFKETHPDLYLEIF